jgi:hypothetical protein
MFLHQPWTMTLMMFIGEFLCLALYFGKRWQENRDKKRHPEEIEVNSSLLAAEAGENQSDAQESTKTETVTLKSTLVCFFPALCDVIGTTAYVAFSNRPIYAVACCLVNCLWIATQVRDRPAIHHKFRVPAPARVDHVRNTVLNSFSLPGRQPLMRTFCCCCAACLLVCCPCGC